jgi:beta-lactamase class D
MMRKVRVLACVLILFAACTVNNTTEDNSVEKYFKANNVTGTFAMFDNGTGEFTVYNMNRYRDSAYLPASTFKIVNSLIGIETGRVKDSTTIIPWDSVVRKIPEWNRDLTMQDAFRYSCVPWYQELARRIGKDTMQHWLDTLGYARSHAKPVITNNLDTFWLDNTVKVTADEQLGLVKKLYFGQLPFQPRSQRMVKNMMLQEDNSNYKLSYKTGWAITDQQHALGWLIGWIEENRHPYFFVLQVESPDKNYDMSKVRLQILKDILKQYGFMEGKR